MRHFFTTLLLVHLQLMPSFASAQSASRKIGASVQRSSKSAEASAVEDFLKHYGDREIVVNDFIREQVEHLEYSARALAEEKLKLISEPLSLRFEKLTSKKISIRIENVESTLETVSLQDRAFRLNGHMVHMTDDLPFAQAAKLMEIAQKQKSRTALLYDLFFQPAEAFDFSSIISTIMGFVSAAAAKKQAKAQFCNQVSQGLNYCNYATNETNGTNYNAAQQVFQTYFSIANQSPPGGGSCPGSAALSACLNQAYAIQTYGHGYCWQPPPGLVIGYQKPPCPTGATPYAGAADQANKQTLAAKQAAGGKTLVRQAAQEAQRGVK